MKINKLEQLNFNFFNFIGSKCEGNNLMILRSRGEPTPQLKKKKGDTVQPLYATSSQS